MKKIFCTVFCSVLLSIPAFSSVLDENDLTFAALRGGTNTADSSLTLTLETADPAESTSYGWQLPDNPGSDSYIDMFTWTLTGTYDDVVTLEFSVNGPLTNEFDAARTLGYTIRLTTSPTLAEKDEDLYTLSSESSANESEGGFTFTQRYYTRHGWRSYNDYLSGVDSSYAATFDDAQSMTIGYYPDLPISWWTPWTITRTGTGSIKLDPYSVSDLRAGRYAATLTVALTTYN